MFVFQDWYLDWPLAGLLLKALLPIALVVNIVGSILGITAFPAGERPRQAAALALHGIPLVAGAGFVWWLFFGVSI